jgi:hypothetical protein
MLKYPENKDPLMNEFDEKINSPSRSNFNKISVALK